MFDLSMALSLIIVKIEHIQLFNICVAFICFAIIEKQFGMERICLGLGEGWVRGNAHPIVFQSSEISGKSWEKSCGGRQLKSAFLVGSI